MGVAQQIDDFFKNSGQTVFIEAEAKESRMRDFIAEYNRRLSENLSISDEGIISLEMMRTSGDLNFVVILIIEMVFLPEYK